MTGNEANKQLAADFCRLYTEGSWDELEKLLGEDFRWRQPTSQRRQFTRARRVLRRGASGTSGVPGHPAALRRVDGPLMSEPSPGFGCWTSPGGSPGRSHDAPRRPRRGGHQDRAPRGDPFRSQLGLQDLATRQAQRGARFARGGRPGRLLRRLAADADILVESFAPGTTSRLGIDYEALHALNPRHCPTPPSPPMAATTSIPTVPATPSCRSPPAPAGSGPSAAAS